MNLLKLTPALALLTLSAQAQKPEEIIQNFEGDAFEIWTTEGEAFGDVPTAGGQGDIAWKVSGYSDESFASSFEKGYAGKGILQSPEFTINADYITFLIGGGSTLRGTSMQLWVEGKIVREAVGRDDLTLRRKIWTVREFKGQRAQLRIVDNSETAAIFVDHILMRNHSNANFPRATQNGNPFTPGMQTSKGAMSGVQYPQNTTLQLFANHKEHGVSSPTALTFDYKGRLYLAETWRFSTKGIIAGGINDNRYRDWVPEDIASQTTADRMAMYKRWAHKYPAKQYTANAEKIRLLQDTDDDGIANKQSLFVDDFNDPLDGTLAGVFAYGDTLFAANIPHIWALKDANGDDKISRDERHSVQEGFGVRVSFSGHDLNGFALGPDGRLYSTVGDRGFNIKTKEGKHYVYPGQGAVLRFEPDGSNLEVIHTGLRNPKEIAFDKLGNAFSVDNNSDQGDQARIVYIMDGGDTGWRMGHQTLHSFHTKIGLEERPINQWMQEKMWMPENPQQPHFMLPPLLNLTSGPSGLAYEPGGYMENFKDNFFICDFRGNASNSGITAFSLEEYGAGMRVSSTGAFNWGVAATDVEFSYDGKCFVTDFGGGWKSAPQGNVYSLTPKNEVAQAQGKEVGELFKQGFESLSNERLIKLLEHKDMRVRLHAHIKLAGRKGTTKTLTNLANTSNDRLVRLHSVWALGIQARRHNNSAATQALVELLKHNDDQVRSRSAEALGESTLEYGDPLLPLLADKSKRVRAFAALALARKPLATPNAAKSAIEALILENNDQDAYLRHAGVMALHTALSPEELANYTSHKGSSLRLAAVLGLRRHKSDLLTNFLEDSHSDVRNGAIRAIHDQELKGAQAILCEKINLLTTKYKKGLTPMMLRRLVHSAYRVGGEKNLKRMFEIAGNSSLDDTQRLEVFRLITLWKQPHHTDQSLGRHAPLEARDDSYVKSCFNQFLPSFLNTGGPLVTIAALKLATELDLQIDNLAELAKTSPSELVRAQALTSLSQHNNKAALTLASEMVNDTEIEVVNAALGIISTATGPEVEIALSNATKANHAAIRQKAWIYLSDLKTKSSAKLVKGGLEALLSDTPDLESAIEILNAAEKRKDPEVKKALQAYRKATKSNFDKQWQVALQGGDPIAGGKIFKSHGAAQCMRCHAVNYKKGHGAAEKAGPNLAGVSLRGDAKHLLDSLIRPNAHIADGFGIASITFTNNATAQGLVTKSTDDYIDVKLGDKLKRIQRSDIKTLKMSPSAMPDMKGILTKAEIRDVVAFLATQKKKNKDAKKTKTPEAFELSKLKITSAAPSSIERGKALYATCAACHGPEGKPLAPIFPPLAGSEWVSGPKENLIRMQIRGLMGPIKVAGKEYNSVMPPSTLNDKQIADVLNYVRATFANKNDEITAEEVAKTRATEAGKPMLKATELIQP